MHYLIIGPFEVAIVAYFLYVQIGWPSFVGIGLLLLLAPAQMFMGRLLMRFRYVYPRNTTTRQLLVYIYWPYTVNF